MAKNPIIKRRDAAATRQAILAAAHRRFVSSGYDQVGLREIAGDAGVDVALISRYFGGKEGLFLEVLVPAESKPVFAPDMTVDEIADYLCDLMLNEDGKGREHEMEMFIIMLRSVSSPKAGAIIRNQIAQDLLNPISTALKSEDSDWRANMALALMLGMGMLHSMMQSEGLDCMAQQPDYYRERLKSLFGFILSS